jgi:hypothetical protein
MTRVNMERRAFSCHNWAPGVVNYSRLNSQNPQLHWNLPIDSLMHYCPDANFSDRRGCYCFRHGGTMGDVGQLFSKIDGRHFEA